jgi:hypothetical protein
VTLVDRVCTALDARGIPHALIGAAALAAAGIARSTFDVDLLTGDAHVLRSDLWEGLRADGVRIDVRPGDHDDPLGGVVRLEDLAARPVDIILGKHDWQRRAVARAIRRPGGPAVVTPCDLILLKLYAGGTQDLWDVRELLRVAGDDALVAEVEADLESLPRAMRDRWASVLG